MNQGFKYCIRCKKYSIMTLESNIGYNYITRMCVSCDYKYYKVEDKVYMVKPWYIK